MSDKFKVGQIVVWTGENGKTRPEWIGLRLTVLRGPDNSGFYNVSWLDPVPSDFGRNEFLAYPSWIRPNDDKLDFSKPIRMRNGGKAEYIGFSGDLERPILAKVALDGEMREVTFQESGLFYKHFYQDIDLVSNV